MSYYFTEYCIMAEEDFSITPLIRKKDDGYQKEKCGIYSDGLFYLEKKFYNSQGEEILDVSNYNLDSSQYPFFKEGKCLLVLKNPNGVAFHTEIDKKGSRLYEPVEGYH